MPNLLSYCSRRFFSTGAQEVGSLHTRLSDDQINQLRCFNTCVISDAIETFGVRLRNEGFATVGFRCLFKNLPPLAGYAATCKVRSAHPPIVGSRYVERTDWWKHTQLPAVAGRIAEKKKQVIELSKKPGATFEELGQAIRELLDFDMDQPEDGANQWK